MESIHFSFHGGRFTPDTQKFLEYINIPPTKRVLIPLFPAFLRWTISWSGRIFLKQYTVIVTLYLCKAFSLQRILQVHLWSELKPVSVHWLSSCRKHRFWSRLFLSHDCGLAFLRRGAVGQTSSRLHKTVINYNYFQFMKDDYIFIFARGITITLLIIHFLNSRLRLYLITITIFFVWLRLWKYSITITMWLH